MRLACCVPFCKRTTGRFSSGDWICGTHWRAIPRAVKQPLFAAERQYKRRFGDNAYWAYKGGSPERLEAVRLHGLIWDLWAAVKAAAIERAAGI